MKQLLLTILFIACITNVLVSQDNSRRIWPEEYTKSAPSEKPKVAHPKKPVYKIATPQVIVENVTPETVVGVTIWKLRTTEGGSTATIESGSTQWTPERVDAGTPLAKGDH